MKKYLKYFSAITVSLLTLGVGINFWIDPLWLFSHNHSYNRFQHGIDTRKQKAHRLAFGQEQYDALLLGSSRLVAADPSQFLHEKVFNGAVEALQHWNFLHHMDFFVKAKGVPKKLYLGVDFIDSGSIPNDHTHQVHWDELQPLFYRSRMLLSFDALRYALRGAAYNFSNSTFAGDQDLYARAGYKLDRVFSEEDAHHRANNELIAFEKKINQYIYSNAMKTTIVKLQNKYPQTQLILFTTPISQPLFSLYEQQGLLPHYHQWLCDMASITEQFYNFMGENTITKDTAHFADAHHAYGHELKPLINCISGAQCNATIREDVSFDKQSCDVSHIDRI